MEIKTAKEIHKEEQILYLSKDVRKEDWVHYWNKKKWVSFDDLINNIDDVMMKNAHGCCEECLKLLKKRLGA